MQMASTQARGRPYRKVEDKGVRLSPDGDQEDRLADIVVVRHDQLVGMVLLQLVRYMCRRTDGADDGSGERRGIARVRAERRAGRV